MSKHLKLSSTKEWYSQLKYSWTLNPEGNSTEWLRVWGHRCPQAAQSAHISPDFSKSDMKMIQHNWRQSLCVCFNTLKGLTLVRPVMSYLTDTHQKWHRFFCAVPPSERKPWCHMRAVTQSCHWAWDWSLQSVTSLLIIPITSHTVGKALEHVLCRQNAKDELKEFGVFGWLLQG